MNQKLYSTFCLTTCLNIQNLYLASNMLKICTKPICFEKKKKGQKHLKKHYFFLPQNELNSRHQVINSHHTHFKFKKTERNH